VASLPRRIGVVSAILAGAWLAYELLHQPQAPQPLANAEGPPLDEIVIPDLAVEAPLLAEFDNTLERPLFRPDRRPGEDAEEEAAGDATPAPTDAVTNLRLSAIIVEADERSALLEQPGMEQAQRVHVGESIGGWLLEEVRDDAVVLSAGGRRTDLVLRTYEAPPIPPARPTRAVQPRRPPGTRPSRRPLPPPPDIQAAEPDELEPPEAPEPPLPQVRRRDD
jgi:hypothetical protein